METIFTAEEDFPGRLLHQAALWDNNELLEDLLRGDQKAHINSQDSWGRTPLHAAALTEKSKCLALLLASGADPNIPCGPKGELRTALHVSAECGHISNVKLLHQFGAKLTAKDKLGLTPLDLAERSEQKECVPFLQQAANEKENKKLQLHALLHEACLSKDYKKVKLLLQNAGADASTIVNLAPNGSNTLLFLCTEGNDRDLMSLLLDNGADGRFHPVTKYSPLYIACYNGYTSCAEILLKRFPALVRHFTVEKWLPIHAACIGGHVSVLELLLTFEYPQEFLVKYCDTKNEWQYQMPFDINMKDASGQTVLYLACLLGNIKMVETLLKFRVKAVKINKNQKSDSQYENNENIEVARKKKISGGIQNIMHRLNLRSKFEHGRKQESEKLISPIILDCFCSDALDTALHVAIKNKHREIAMLLLSSGADPNLSTLRATRNRSDDSETDSCLEEACKNRDITLIDCLLKYGARDDSSRALKIAIENRDDILIAKLLAIRAHADPEYMLNNKIMTDQWSNRFVTSASMSYISMYPKSPVMINWHGSKCQMNQIKSNWLVEAALHINPKLKLNPKNLEVALFAITRLDISNNALTSLPLSIFQLPSLRYLNLSQNKLEKLPCTENAEKNSSGSKKCGFNLPVIEELCLQNNRLESIPEHVFNLPSLVTLDLSNNKLHTLPANLWLAPQLKELNVSLNLLKYLPVDTALCGNQESSYIFEETHCDVFEKKSAGSKEINSYSKVMEMKPLKHINVWNSSVEITEQIALDDSHNNCSKLSSLNLAHNSFDSVPPMLACLAVNLTRLNLSYNGLKSMGYITSYPFSIKQLDLSYNSISKWFDFPPAFESNDTNLMCYCNGESSKALKGLGSQSPVGGHRKILMNLLCIHRRHLKLDNIRTLVLSNNNLDKIQLVLDKDFVEEFNHRESINSLSANSKSKLIYPNVSMLDLSNNKLKEVSSKIQELTNLSVLNISGNHEICELPPQMGLLSRLWNLNTTGCNLQEPLKSMIESKKYKTMDVVGYLKSILEDARPYARIKLMIVGVQGIGKTSLLEQLRQEGISYKKKPHDHWAKRMGNKNINMKTPKGVNMSTVGVDIGLWVYDKKGNKENSKGPVTFRTWDFGGQREYYATHQYFLSKRSLYLVVWKISDGHKGIRDIRQWLVNIQARAPNSPVLIVGTHFDEIIEKNLLPLSEDLQQIIRNRFINVVDAEKCGLPRVLETIEVSCKNRHNIKLLCNLIYDTVYSLKYPGSKELLLDQRVPASYLALEDVIIHLAADRRASGIDPVLNAEQYKAVVDAEMHYRYHKSFRDWPELHQATLFLHENGVLLHYEDATLRNLYFLDPQWLCDMLAHVVTIREINPFARSGVMKLTDLKHVFKSSNVNSADTRSYIVNLLNKFEVALTWDNCSLLIPSLLPSEEDMQAPYSSSAVRVKIPVRSRGWAVRAKKLTVSASSSLAGISVYGSTEDQLFSQTSSPVGSSSQAKEEIQRDVSTEFEITVEHQPEKTIRRFLLMSYFPSGFWSRLITRMLADDAIIEIVRNFFSMPKAMKTDFRLAQWLDIRTEWILWQTGMSLQYGSTMLFRMREVLSGTKTSSFDYRNLKFRIQQEGTWLNMDLSNTSILEIFFPFDGIIIKRTKETEYPEFAYLHPNIENVTKLLALAVDHIDTLLEDWYPTLGTRFVHTSEGKFLVTRLIPCPQCWPDTYEKEIYQSLHHIGENILNENFALPHQRHSQESIISDNDSGVGAESVDSSRKPSVDGFSDLGGDIQKNENPPIFSWMVEECVLAACTSDRVVCPTHGEILLMVIAPDTLFIDLGERYLIKSDFITRGSLLGRGAFGFVFKGSCKIRGFQHEIEVALKMLQPVQPDPNARHSVIMAFKVAQGKWNRDPLQYACKAYCTARQELNILLNLRHPNIVPLIGVCTRPLALILDLAPQGALDATLKNYRRSGAKIRPDCLQEIILQVAKAIEYLHQQHIIYRDLKSENVLIWNLPSPFQNTSTNVHVKLADYGISRLTLPSGSKGFGGTEGFMAPEIMKFNGEEEYTEKVDCFSFGMFIYELLTLHQPFEGHESVKEYILEGGRPPLTYRETLYPSCILDLMVLCWAQKPKDRPSASQIVSFASSPEFTQLYDCTVLDDTENVSAATAWVLVNSDEHASHEEVWIAGDSFIYLLTASQSCWDSYSSINLSIPAATLCLVNNEIWMGDFNGNIYAYQTGTLSVSWKYALGDAPIVAILFLQEFNRVAVGLRNGRLFLVRSDATPATASMGEGSFVLTELGSSENLFSLAHLQTDKHACEVWVGEASGYISIFTIKEEIVTNHDRVNHYNPIIEKVDRVEVVSCQDSGICSYVYPGCMVYQWNTKAREITSTLDCMKLVPCSESLKPLTLEDLAEKCQVTAVSVLDCCIYIGTAWGCVIVAERSCLYPLMVFRPFEEEVKLILPLFSCCEGNGKRNEIILGGKGYRSLPIRNKNMVLTPNQILSSQQSKYNFHLLLWRHSL